MRKLKILYNLPVVGPDGHFKNVNDSFFVFYSGENVLYQFPNYITTENEETILSKDVRYSYFLHRQRSAYGLFYDSVNDTYLKRMAVDSILRKKALFGGNFYDESTDSLVKVSRQKTNYSLVETYASKVKNDPIYADTSLFYYTDKIKNIDFSLSKKLDSIKKLKVCKVRLIYNSQIYPGYSFQAPRREFLFELREEPFGEPKKILFLFNRFESEWVEK